MSYTCYLNGKPYGRGDLPYMTELFKAYFEICQMYGRNEASFTVVKNKDSDSDYSTTKSMTFREWYRTTRHDEWKVEYADLGIFCYTTCCEYKEYCKSIGIEPIWD